MSESNHIDINSLHNTVLRETENDSLLEIKPNFYRNLSDFIGNLRKQEFEGVENKIKETMIEMATELTSLLIHIRLEKISSSNDYDIGYLLDEEKFIIDSQDEQNERTEMILSATINGKSKFLESLAENHKIKKIVVRFLENLDEIGRLKKRQQLSDSEYVSIVKGQCLQQLMMQQQAQMGHMMQ